MRAGKYPWPEGTPWTGPFSDAVKERERENRAIAESYVTDDD